MTCDGRTAHPFGARTVTTLYETAEPGAAPFPSALVLTPTSRWPTRLPDATVRTVLANPLPARLSGADAAAAPLVSIIVVALDNLAFNRLCLESVLVNTASPSYEVIVVDNGSTDDTPAYLRELAAIHPNVRVLTNARNLGFAPAVNQGLADAAGDVLVLLNNDTVVPPGWLTGLVRHLEVPDLGLIGPVTNRAANEAQIEVDYHTYGEFLDFARAYTEAHAGQTVEASRLIMFCAAMRRDAYERVGPFDEQFAVAMFEDDDYVLRARQAGYRIECAEDVFIHHFGQATIGHLAASREYGALFDRNRRRFEEKWAAPWETHQPRRRVPHQQLRERVRQAVEATLPLDAVVLVVSKGDDDLLGFRCRQAWHFPQLEHGQYAGHHPADSADAIAQLEELRAKGGNFLVLPATTLWWLDHYEGFRQHIESRYRVLLEDRDTCLIFAL